MKKVLSLIMALVLVAGIVALAGCGKEEAKPEETGIKLDDEELSSVVAGGIFSDSNSLLN